MTPGRWLLLAIGVPVALAIIGWTGFTLVALVGQASFNIADTIPVTNHQVTLNIDGGDLTAHVRTGTTARLTGRVQYSLVRPKFTENNTASGTTVGLQCRIPTGNCGLAAVLVVPPQTAVTLSGGGGDLAISGLQARATLTTGGGDLSADDLAGPLSLSTSGGDIGITDLTSPTVAADSGGGDVSLIFTQVPRNLNIVSDGGDINVVLPSGATGYNVTTTSDGGDVSESVAISSSSPDKITVDSGGGDINLSTAS
jgi:hypothetical protein